MGIILSSKWRIIVGRIFRLIMEFKVWGVLLVIMYIIRIRYSVFLLLVGLLIKLRINLNGVGWSFWFSDISYEMGVFL